MNDGSDALWVVGVDVVEADEGLAVVALVLFVIVNSWRNGVFLKTITRKAHYTSIISSNTYWNEKAFWNNSFNLISTTKQGLKYDKNNKIPIDEKKAAVTIAKYCNYLSDIFNCCGMEHNSFILPDVYIFTAH